MFFLVDGVDDDDDDEKDKARNNLSVTVWDTDESKGLFFWQVNLQCEHDEKTLFVFITNILWDKSMNIWT